MNVLPPRDKSQKAKMNLAISCEREAKERTNPPLIVPDPFRRAITEFKPPVMIPALTASKLRGQVPPPPKPVSDQDLLNMLRGMLVK
jgi:hypothetical protein